MSGRGTVVKHASRRQDCGVHLGRPTSTPACLSRPCRPRVLAARCSESSNSPRSIHVEVEAAEPPVPGPSNQRPSLSSVQTYHPGDDRLFKVLLAVITKLWSSPDQLERFIISRPEPTSMPFLMWLADQEAQASGQQQALLAGLCELLVVRRERLDRERMEQLYLETLDLLTTGAAELSASSGIALLQSEDAWQEADAPRASLGAGLSGSDGEAAGSSSTDEDVNASSRQRDTDVSSTRRLGDRLEASERDAEGQMEGGQLQQAMLLQSQRREEGVALLSSSPDLYAAMLAERLTGVPATVDGYSPVYDLLLKAAPPAALTEQGIKKAHADAAELAVDMKQMRKRSVATMIGRAKLTAEQADRLKAGSPASRILDMLLTAVSTNEERVACLGDCFTPPEQGMQGGEEQGEQATEELWCTPAQLLSEVEVRIRSMSGGGAAAATGADGSAPRLLESRAQMSGPELLDSLQQLRAAVMAHLMSAMQQ